MADVKTFRNRLKLPQESARRIAIMDLRRVAPEDRDAAAGVLIDHLPKEPNPANRLKILHMLGEWNRIDSLNVIKSLLNDPDPKIIDAARQTIEHLNRIL